MKNTYIESTNSNTLFIHLCPSFVRCSGNPSLDMDGWWGDFPLKILGIIHLCCNHNEIYRNICPMEYDHFLMIPIKFISED